MTTRPRWRGWLDRLPLGEPTLPAPVLGDAEAKRRLASLLDVDEETRWAGWVWTARGDRGTLALDESLAAVTDRRLVWVPVAEGLEPDVEDLTPVRRLLVDKRSKRIVLDRSARRRSDDHPIDPDAAVIWAFEPEGLMLALGSAIGGPRRPEEPGPPDGRPPPPPPTQS